MPVNLTLAPGAWPVVEANHMADFMDAAAEHQDSARLRAIVFMYYDYAPLLGIDPTAMCIQGIIETSWPTHEGGRWHPFNSWWARQHNNFAGLGVEGKISYNNLNSKPLGALGRDWQWDSQARLWRMGLHFPNTLWGVLAHLYHMQLYITGQHPGSVETYFNQRLPLTYEARKSKYVARTSADLQGTWAADPEYNSKWESKISEIVAWHK